jgi:hypothetical protein
MSTGGYDVAARSYQISRSLVSGLPSVEISLAPSAEIYRICEITDAAFTLNRRPLAAATFTLSAEVCRCSVQTGAQQTSLFSLAVVLIDSSYSACNYPIEFSPTTEAPGNGRGNAK